MPIMRKEFAVEMQAVKITSQTMDGTMLRFKRWTLLLALLLFAACSKDSSTNPEQIDPVAARLAELDTRIRFRVSADGLPSLAACIIKADSIVWQNYYGFVDAAKTTAPTAETVYYLASISKTVTATAIMQLWERGLLDLDADINGYLPFTLRNPNFPDTPITTRHLLTHRSGLAWPNGEDPNFYRTYPGATAPPLGEWLREYLRPEGALYVAAMWKNTQPGRFVQYSNAGGALLGYIVEAITGQDFAEYCRVNIFAPLGMTNTGFRVDQFESQQDFAPVHTSLNNVTQPYSVTFYPATTVLSSIADFSHFSAAILNGGSYNGQRILAEATVTEMLSLQVVSAGLAHIWWAQGDNYMGHTGSFVGVSSSMDVNRATKTGVIIFTNIGNKSTVWPGGDIYSLLHEEAKNY